MKKLDNDQVLYLHNLMCDATGGFPGIRDSAGLESAIYHAYGSFEGKDLYKSVEEKTARQAYGIIRNRPFIDGYKRTGFFVMLVYLGTCIADGRINPVQIIEWILKHKKK
jgi:death on curing protein